SIKRLLVMTLAEALPLLAERIAGLSHQEFKLLLSHLRPRPQSEPSHGLTPDEVEAIAAAGVLLLPHTRFATALKRAIVRRLAEWRPDLSMKVLTLSLRQFTSLCAQINGRARGD